MKRVRIALRGKLNGVVPQHLAAPALVTGLAVADAGDRVRPALAKRVGGTPASDRDALRLAPVGAPGVGGIEPAVRPAFHVARLDAPAGNGKLLPQARADRKRP